MLFSEAMSLRKLQQQTFEQTIPENLLKDPKVRMLARSLEKSIKAVTDWSEKLNYTQNIEDLPDEILEHLLWEKHITWNEGLALAKTREQKINLIKNAVDLHRTKGTPAAIETVLKALNLPGEVIEWKQYDGKPYHFMVEVTTDTLPKDVLVNLHNMISEFKNERSWLENVVIRVASETLILNLKTYDFDVPYRICNVLRTDDIAGKAVRFEVPVYLKHYAFDAGLPICNTFVTSTVNSVPSNQNVVLAVEYRNTDILYVRPSENTHLGEGEI